MNLKHMVWQKLFYGIAKTGECFGLLWWIQDDILVKRQGKIEAGCRTGSGENARMA